MSTIGSAKLTSGSLEDDLLALVDPWAKELAARPYGRVLSAFISRAQSDPAFAEEYRARFVEPRRSSGHARKRRREYAEFAERSLGNSAGSAVSALNVTFE